MNRKQACTPVSRPLQIHYTSRVSGVETDKQNAPDSDRTEKKKSVAN